VRVVIESMNGARFVHRTSVAEGKNPAEVLIERSGEADLLVVGSRGHGGFLGMRLGSLSQHLVGHANCPVVVVR
jgi:nucleotide-binding universal stress UspA family protein